MTPEQLHEDLRTAAWVLSCQRSGLPAGYRAYWPEIPVTGYWEVWSGLTARERVERADEFNATQRRPTGQEIAILDLVLEWVLPLSRCRRWLVWAVARGRSYRSIGRELRWSDKTVKRRYARVLDEICWGQKKTFRNMPENGSQIASLARSVGGAYLAPVRC